MTESAKPSFSSLSLPKKVHHLAPTQLMTPLTKRSLDLNSQVPLIPSIHGFQNLEQSLIFTTLVESNKEKVALLSHRKDQSSTEDVQTVPTIDIHGPLVGSIANVFWRALSMEDLRCHPLYQSLPSPEYVQVQSIQDLGLFRQDSWQWGVLHQGRLTTSKLASVLGFYESDAAEYLSIPNSLRGHQRAVAAWQHLRQKPPVSYADLSSSRPSSDTVPSLNPIWKQVNGSNFAYDYTPSPSPPSVQSSSRAIDVQSIRLQWGSAQEPVALLAALNYLHRLDPAILLAESGMCLLEALEEMSSTDAPSSTPSSGVRPRALYQYIQQWLTAQTLPLLGASPDGMIHHPDGSMSVLEVKCSSPFSQSSQGLQVRPSRDRGRDRSVPAWHIPQLQLEMLCAGSRCSHALLLVLSIDGAVLYRLERDEQYMLEMLGWARSFYVQHIQGVARHRVKAPLPNYFSPKRRGQGADRSQAYAAFLQRTQQLAKRAQVVKELSAEEIQRSPLRAHYFL
jgi:hypothetical protein